MQSSHHTVSRPLSHRAIALAAMTQSATLVNQIATHGHADHEDCRVLIESIFFTDAPSPAKRLYGDPERLKTGLKITHHLLAGKHTPEDRAIMVYCSSLLAIEKKLTGRAPLIEKLGDGIHRINKQQQYFGDVMHSNIIAAIADLYGETISTIKPRIIVRGKTEHLSRTDNTRLVRTLLLSGLRAAHQWRREGGGHLTLLLKRKALMSEIETVLQECNHPIS